jgi:hypothetical protein
LAIPDHPSLLVSLEDRPADPADTAAPPHALGKLQGHRHLAFADVTPEEHRETWNVPLAPHGRPVAEVMMDQTAGKRLWRFLKGHYGCNPEVVVIADGGDRRALSVAYAVCDALRLPRAGTVYTPEDPEARHDGPAGLPQEKWSRG